MKTSMKSTVKLRSASGILIAMVLICFAFSPKTHAVSPPPDGGYPGGNTAEGQNALLSLTTGTYNTAVGLFSLLSNDIGGFNTAVGAGALLVNTDAANTATGAAALFSNTTGGAGNTANGAFALFNNTTGSENVAVGDSAGLNQTTGSNNVYIADFGIEGESDVIAIGTGGIGPHTATFIDGIFGVTTGSATTAPVIVDEFGQLGTVVSSERFKKNIATMEKASEAILSLRPVTFHYKTDAKGTPQFGLIAEEVAKVNPSLVLLDKGGKPYTVRYDAVNAMLLNEFLKEHKKVEEQQATITELKSTVAQQQKGMEVLTAQVKEQAAQIQKVSAQVELNKPASRAVANK
jgi:hypothetical protein